MLQTVRCIKFGEILLDKNRHPFLLCQNCHADFVDLMEFRKHLESCNGLENFFRKNAALIFDSTKGTQLFGRAVNGEFKEYRVYEPCEVQNIEAVEQPTLIVKENYIDLIEEELMDPRWYTDLAGGQQSTILTTSSESTDKVLAYNELVEAVTPYVQFKENLKANNKAHNIMTSSATTTPTSDLSHNNSSGGAAAITGRQYVKGTPTPLGGTKFAAGVKQQVRARHTTPSTMHGLNNKANTNAMTNKSAPMRTIILSLDPSPQQHQSQQQQQLAQNVVGIPIETSTNANGSGEYAINNASINTTMPSVSQTKTLKTYQRPVIQSVKSLITNPVPPLARLSLPPPPQNSVGAQTKVFIQKSVPPPTSAIVQSVQRITPPTQQQQQQQSQQQLPSSRRQQSKHQSQQQQQQQKLTRSMPKSQMAPQTGVKRAIATQQTLLVVPPAKQAHNPANVTTTATTVANGHMKAVMQSMPVPALAPVQQSSQVAAPKTKQTEQILNKLQTLGLQVKRTSPSVTDPKAAEALKTDELLKKLRSKGMNVKLLNKHNNNNNNNGNSKNDINDKSKNAAATTATAAVPVKRSRLDAATTQTAPSQQPVLQKNKSNLNKNIIIRKVK